MTSISSGAVTTTDVGTFVNRRSQHLVILVATYNRLDLLKRTLAAIEATTRCDHEVIVIDGGSNDGTIEYIELHPRVTPVLQGELLGSARCYNSVWRHVDSRYTCWLSDDTELTPGALDQAVEILDADAAIGMVGLKMRDVLGPGEKLAYMGGISEYGILTCNHGVLPTELLRAVGYFNESYRSYTIDPDLTASVLCAGKQVVMTKQTAILHHRAWVESEPTERMTAAMGGVDNWAVYREKFRFLAAPISRWRHFRYLSARAVRRLLFRGVAPQASRFGLTLRDVDVYSLARFIRLSDLITSAAKQYYLTQRIPPALLLDDANPYRELAEQNYREAG